MDTGTAVDQGKQNMEPMDKSISDDVEIIIEKYSHTVFQLALAKTKINRWRK